MFALPVASYDRLPWLERFRGRVNDEIRAQTLASFLPVFRERYQRRLDMRAPDLTARVASGDTVLRGLQQGGYALGALPDESKRLIRELTHPICTELHASLDDVEVSRFSDGHIRLDAEQHAPIFSAVSASLGECGAMDALSAYAGRRLLLYSLGLQVNTAKETKARYGELDTSGLPERSTSYLHVDSNDWPGVKVLIYLSDVDQEQGPFRYVAGSQSRMGPFEAAVRKTNDKLRHSVLELCALPAHFAQHANFGDYIDPVSPVALQLLKEEVTVCDGRSDLLLFDNNGVHRGGFVRDGHRYMLQCTFMRAPKALKGAPIQSRT
ncbi:MAG TPA: hypothetical protein VIJ94_11330 [Caulobacteraceae bacterium]